MSEYPLGAGSQSNRLRQINGILIMMRILSGIESHSMTKCELNFQGNSKRSGIVGQAIFWNGVGTPLCLVPP